MSDNVNAFKSRSGGGATVEVIANCYCGAYLYWNDKYMVNGVQYPESWYCKARCGQEYHLNSDGTLYPIHENRDSW